MIDHALMYNNIIIRFTYESLGWVSAAEGFVFLSGLTAGIVYTRKATERGAKFILGLAVKRARTIYLKHLALFLFISAIILFVPLLGDYWASRYPPLLRQPLLGIVMGALLVYQPFYLDILPMYVVFILFVPFVIRWFQKGYAGYLLLGSLTLYTLSSANELLSFFTIPFQDSELNTRLFNLPCWQILFVLGLFAGFIFSTGKSKYWQVNKHLFYISLASSVLFFICRSVHMKIPYINMDYATDKANLGPLRLLNFIALCYSVIFISSKRGAWFTSRPICYLGKYSLEVFSFHIVILILLVPIKEQLNSIYSMQITSKFYFYPLDTLFVFFFMIPLLFLAPTLFGKNKKPALPPVLSKPL